MMRGGMDARLVPQVRGQVESSIHTPPLYAGAMAFAYLTLLAWRAKRGRVVPGRTRGVLHPPKRPPKAGSVGACSAAWCPSSKWETSAPSAPQRGRDGAPVTRTSGAHHLIASARPFAHGRAKRHPEHGDSPFRL